MLPLFQKTSHYLVQIIQTPHDHNRKTSQMRGHRDWLRLHIADNPDTQSRTRKPVQLRLELIPEISTLQTMDRTIKIHPVIKSHTGTLRSQVRMVIRTIKHICHTILTRYTAKKSAHILSF